MKCNCPPWACPNYERYLNDVDFRRHKTFRLNAWEKCYYTVSDNAYVKACPHRKKMVKLQRAFKKAEKKFNYTTLHEFFVVWQKLSEGK